LTTLRGGEDRSLDDVVDRFVRELDAARAAAKGLRGDARAAFLERLRTLDDELIAAARGLCTAPVLQQLEGEADEELAPFRARMPREAFEQSRRAAVDRLLRERRRLPVVTFD
jgi:DNA-binding GntR family transcriptional regulator